MRLTHIKLSGFKSFVDPTTIAVPGRLVAVIGPNGCGKSNVIDAVRWVLGEASARQLRGESMQDVIFNGANTRRPAPRASVELVFDNSDGQLQGAWGQYAEVAIKRQLTRQGDSTYYINNQVVRRRDITDLFLGTGVGARGYAVIEQGMISRIIEARPEELRAHIEEAAGVSKYKERRRETENRLAETREHLQRLADLQSELDRQVEKLQRQANTARRYQELKAQIADKQDLFDYSQWQQALHQADSATLLYQQHGSAQETLQQQVEALEETLQQLRQQEQQQQQQVREAEMKRAGLREQWARLEEQIRHRRDWQQRIAREQAQAQTELQRLHNEDQQQQEQLKTAGMELEEQQLQREQWALQAAEHEARMPELEELAHQGERTRQNQQNELARLERELAIKQQQHQHATSSINQLQQRQQRLQEELAQLALPQTEELQQAQDTAAELEQVVATLEENLLQYEQQRENAQQTLILAQQQHRQLDKQQLTLSAQVETLIALLPQAERSSIADVTDADIPLLWQHMQVAPQWQHATSVVLGHKLQAQHTEQLKLADILPECTTVWINQADEAEKQPLAPNALLQHIEVQAPFTQAIHYWLGQVLCAETLDAALLLQADLQPHQLIVTPEGHSVDAVSVTLYTEDNGISLLQQQQQLREQQQAQVALEKPLQQAAEAMQLAQRNLENTETQLNQCQQQLKQQQQHWQTASAQATELLARTGQGQLRREHIQQESALINSELTQQQQVQQQSQADIENLNLAIEQLRPQLQNHTASQHSQQQTLKQSQLALLEARRQQGLVEMAIVRLQQCIQSATQERQRIARDTERWQERQSELALGIAEQEMDDEQTLQTEELNAQIDVAGEQCAAAQQQLQQLQLQLQQTQQQQHSLNSRLPQLQADTQAALLQQQEALLNARRFHETLQQNNANLAALAEQFAQSAQAAPELSQQIAALAQKINALGAVNLAALQELEEAHERAEYYQKQTADVQAAIALLEEAISTIDEETKSRFKTTFDAVNEKVQSYFPTLFGGGEARLDMVGDDLLSAGVSIMARPPGKKNSTIHLLSGGEKALTAMSLVFALFSLNPAPFCLLDEVDAPLDDANTSRFCNLVQQMSAQTQFVYISHNRLTMEMAEQLVGVTMQEKGVSRIVEVNIRQALDMAEA
ncbi:chromosome segregation protein SMC [Snodgrassella communis]|uniref:chromosome segregation protein SMC n=1 Tax=Snodgrassella communis TaxID=2946699 RepID=UPI001EF57ABC|nr:chromosome segregation protein SMC [Snodgrassella communis]